MAITYLVAWKHKNKLLVVESPALDLIFAVLSVTVACRYQRQICLFSMR